MITNVILIETDHIIFEKDGVCHLFTLDEFLHMLMRMGIMNKTKYECIHDGVKFIFDKELVVYCVQAIQAKKEGLYEPNIRGNSNNGLPTGKSR